MTKFNFSLRLNITTCFLLNSFMYLYIIYSLNRNEKLQKQNFFTF
jgi:hypothetical protein